MNKKTHCGFACKTISWLILPIDFPISVNKIVDDLLWGVYNFYDKLLLYAKDFSNR